MSGNRRSTIAIGVILASIAGLGVLGLLPWLDKPMFRDEGASLFSAHLSLSALWEQTQAVDLVLLPYYGLLHLWSNPASGIEELRMLSLLAYGLTVLLVGWLAARQAGGLCGVSAAVVTATNPLMAGAALNARPYALSALAATASVGALLAWLEQGRARWMWAFSVAASATLLLQLLAVLGPLAALLAACVVTPRNFIRGWRQIAAPLGVMSAATVAFTAFAFGQRQQISWIDGPLGLAQTIETLAGPASGGHALYSGTVIVLTAALTLMFVHRRRTGAVEFPPSEVLPFTVIVAWAALPTVVLVSLSFIYPVYVNRYVTASVPGMALALALLAAKALDWRSSGSARRYASAPHGAVLAVAAVVLFVLVTIPAGRAYCEDLRGAAALVAASADEDSVIAIPGHAVTGAVSYYLQRDHTCSSLWPELTVRQQPFLERCAVCQDEATFGAAPDDVWLIDDWSVPSVQRFKEALCDHGFVPVTTRRFQVGANPVDVTHFRRSHHGATTATSVLAGWAHRDEPQEGSRRRPATS